jgi:hypothetical protein
MSIIDKGSVLLLGAGSSKPFGLPLGEELMVEIPRNIDNADYYAPPYTERPSYSNERILGQVFIDPPKQEKKYEINEINELLKIITDQTSESIDDFIRENPSYAVICKRAICANLFFKLYERKDNRFKLRQFESRKINFNNEERNWIHLLINIVRQGVRDEKSSKERKLRIITFNYDTVLEYVLEKQFANTEALAGKQWEDFIEIAHPHGSLGKLLSEAPNPVEMIVEWAKQICVVNDDQSCIPKHVSDDRKRAKEWIRDANRLYVAGFAFAGPNCRLLDFATAGSRLWVEYLNYDGNAGVEIGANRLVYGASSIDRRKVTVKATPHAGTPDKPISIANWIKSGAIGELPG